MNNKRNISFKLLLAFVFVLLCVLTVAQFSISSAGSEQVDAVSKVYWSDKEDNRIWRANLDGSQVAQVALIEQPEALTFNLSRSEMVVVVDGRSIEKMDLKGSSRQVLVEGYPLLWGPNSLAVDHKRESLYWTDSGRDAIGRVDLDGSNVVYQLPPGPDEAKGLVVDEVQGKVYWVNNGRLYRSNLDGSDSELFTELVTVTDMALDLSAGKIYYSQAFYSNFYGYSIKRANLDGSEVESLTSYEYGRSDGIALDLDQGKVYWSERGTTPRILRANLDGTGTETVIDKNVFGPFGLALDTAAGKLYWTDWVSQKIQRANLDGSELEDLSSTVPTRPRYLTLDPAAGKMFWTGDRGASVWQANLDGSDKLALVPGGPNASTGGIGLHKGNGQLLWVDAVSQAVTKAKVDGTETEKIIFRHLEDPQGLALDAARGKMYWADRERDQILRANLDGTAVETLVSEGIDTPTSLALDLLRGKMVWTEPFLQQINQADINGGELEVLLAADDGLIRPNLVALDVSAGKMYWTDWGTRSLRRANLDGSEIEDLVTSGIRLPSGLALKIPLLEVHRSYIPFAGGE